MSSQSSTEEKGYDNTDEKSSDDDHSDNPDPTVIPDLLPHILRREAKMIEKNRFYYFQQGGRLVILSATKANRKERIMKSHRFDTKVKVTEYKDNHKQCLICHKANDYLKIATTPLYFVDACAHVFHRECFLKKSKGNKAEGWCFTCSVDGKVTPPPFSPAALNNMTATNSLHGKKQRVQLEGLPKTPGGDENICITLLMFQGIPSIQSLESDKCTPKNGVLAVRRSHRQFLANLGVAHIKHRTPSEDVTTRASNKKQWSRTMATFTRKLFSLICWVYAFGEGCLPNSRMTSIGKVLKSRTDEGRKELINEMLDLLIGRDFLELNGVGFDGGVTITRAEIKKVNTYQFLADVKSNIALHGFYSNNYLGVLKGRARHCMTEGVYFPHVLILDTLVTNFHKCFPTRRHEHNMWFVTEEEKTLLLKNPKYYLTHGEGQEWDSSLCSRDDDNNSDN